LVFVVRLLDLRGGEGVETQDTRLTTRRGINIEVARMIRSIVGEGDLFVFNKKRVP
jgi:hypothetical protein